MSETRGGKNDVCGLKAAVPQAFIRANCFPQIGVELKGREEDQRRERQS